MARRGYPPEFRRKVSGSGRGGSAGRRRGEGVGYQRAVGLHLAAAGRYRPGPGTGPDQHGEGRAGRCPAPDRSAGDRAARHAPSPGVGARFCAPPHRRYAVISVMAGDQFTASADALVGGGLGGAQQAHLGGTGPTVGEKPSPRAATATHPARMACSPRPPFPLQSPRSGRFPSVEASTGSGRGLHRARPPDGRAGRGYWGRGMTSVTEMVQLVDGLQLALPSPVTRIVRFRVLMSWSRPKAFWCRMPCDWLR